MKSKNNLILLPSKVILPDGTVISIDELDENERKKMMSSICKNLSKQISNYYSSQQDEWKNFLSPMT